MTSHRLPRFRGRLAASAFAFLAVLLSLAGLSGSARAADLGGFGAFPALTAGETQQPAYFQLSVASSHSAARAIVVANSSAQPVSLSLAAVDGVSSETSGAVYANDNVTPRAAARWVELSVRTLTLAPHSRQAIPFRVDVPASAAPGDHLAGIAVQDRQPRRGHGTFAITEIIRVVVGVSIRVPGRTVSGLQVGVTRAAALGGTPDAALDIPLANTGDLYCRPRLTVTLSGAKAGLISVTRQLDTILPGDAIDYPFAWSRGLPSGTYTAITQAAGCGPVRIVSSRFTLSSPLLKLGARISSSPRVITVRSATTLPWLLLIGVALAGLLAGGLLSRRGLAPRAA